MPKISRRIRIVMGGIILQKTNGSKEKYARSNSAGDHNSLKIRFAVCLSSILPHRQPQKSPELRTASQPRDAPAARVVGHATKQSFGDIPPQAELGTEAHAFTRAPTPPPAFWRTQLRSPQHQSAGVNRIRDDLIGARAAAMLGDV